MSVGLISVKGEFLQTLLDLGLDISEFHNFKASFKSELQNSQGGIEVYIDKSEHP